MSLTPRWAPIPPSSGRWLLPTSPRKTAAGSLRIYHPVTVKGLLGWEAARAAAELGAFRLLPGRAKPPAEVTEILADSGISYRSIALARANHPSRFLALLFGESNRAVGVAKMAFDEKGCNALAGEALAIDGATSVLASSVRPPHVRLAARGLLVLDPVDWCPRIAPWRLPVEVARAVGAYAKQMSGTGGSALCAAHGDFAPWNLLRTQKGWVLLDWEHASSSRPAFFDLWHYLLQSHSLLGWPSTRALVHAASGGKGWVRSALVAYADGLARSPDEAIDFLDHYFDASAQQLSGKSRKEREGLNVRVELQRRLTSLHR